MHHAIEHNTKYFRIDPVQYILLRRGSQWKPMVAKISISLFGLYFATEMNAKGYIESMDKSFITGFFAIMASYTVITSSLYFLSYPLGEHVTELPV